jgi:HPt (histidine-containing phosphotransfer) domain-containing protein
MVRAEPTHMATGPCAALLERVGGDQQIFIELCDVFLDDAPKRLDIMREALAAADAPVLQREAHAFKGAAAAFDAEHVVMIARQLEQLAATGDLRDAPRVLAVLDCHSRLLITAVRAGKAHG